VFLRWIYVNDEVQNRGVGSQAMAALKNWLISKGMTRLDTDTALDNCRAQHYYEKNGFTREGITRSYYTQK
jgi:RimJ/RimL family protein N-acetyltransferase